jgi:hypothetical protein
MNSEEIYLYHHLGLGDNISCHGIVRYHCENYKKVYIFCKERNFENVSYMYNDLKNLEIIIADDEEAISYLRKNNINNLKIIGFNLNTNENFELQFYKMAGVPIEYKHSKFFINRDIEKEKNLFDSLEIKENEYIFIHDGGFKLKEEFINPELKVVKPDSNDFFDWIYVIENAKEIHCIDSSFLCLADILNLDSKIKLYNHRYCRNYPDYIKLYTKKNWKFIK